MGNQQASILKKINLEPGKVTTDQAKQLFKQYDQDQDGFLSRTEVGNLLSEWATSNNKEANFDEFMGLFDKNKDNKISIEELLGNEVEDVSLESKKGQWAIDDYLLHDVLGKGGYGIVASGTDPKSGDQLAIKITISTDHADKIEEEALILEKIDHKNIVKMTEYNMQGQYLAKKEDDPFSLKGECEKAYLTLALCENGTLFDLVTMLGGFNERLARTYFRHMLEGVDYMHKQGFTHRDLKAENLLIDSAWQLIIADLGLSTKINDKGIVVDGKRAGTRGYMAPEVVSGSYGAPNDVFAMGVILFAFVLARPPFTDTDGSCPWYRKVEEGDWNTYWRWQAQGGPLEISDEFKDLIPKFFVTEQKRRITIDGIKAHSWYKGSVLSDKDLCNQMTVLSASLDNAMYDNREPGEVTEGFDDGGASRSGDAPKLQNWNIQAMNKVEKQKAGKSKAKTIREDEGLVRGEEEDGKEDAGPEPLVYNPSVRNYTKWTTSDAPQTVYNALIEIAGDKSIEAEEKQNYLLDCSFEDEQANSYAFVIQIFKSKDSDGNYVVEFGRRCKDGAMFRKIFVIFRTAMDAYVNKAAISSTTTVKETTTTTTTTTTISSTDN